MNADHREAPITGLLNFIKSSEPASPLTEERWDAMVEAASKQPAWYTALPKYPPMHPRRYRYLDAECVKAGIKTKDDPLCDRHIDEWLARG